MRESWTDERLDDLNGRVGDLTHRTDAGFERVDADLRALRTETKTEFVALRGEMNSRFERVDERFDAMQRLILQVGGGMFATMLLGFLGVIATVLAQA